MNKSPTKKDDYNIGNHGNCHWHQYNSSHATNCPAIYSRDTSCPWVRELELEAEFQWNWKTQFRSLCTYKGSNSNYKSDWITLHRRRDTANGIISRSHEADATERYPRNTEFKVRSNKSSELFARRSVPVSIKRHCENKTSQIRLHQSKRWQHWPQSHVTAKKQRRLQQTRLHHGMVAAIKW